MSPLYALLATVAVLGILLAYHLLVDHKDDAK